MFASNTSQVSSDAVYVEDVFSTYLFTATGSLGLSIPNGIDLAGKGGLVWEKCRDTALGHSLADTVRGGFKYSASDSPNAETTQSAGYEYVFGSSGYTNNRQYVNGRTYVSWTFREQPKFFDVVTYTGNGANRTIAHSLGSVPGCIIVKRTDTTADWQAYHRSLANTEYLVLNTTAAKATGATRWNSTTPTSTVFSLGTDTTVNANGGTYVAYLFAHDAGGFGATGNDSVISCGSYTGTGAGTPPSITLGWEPQWILIKSATNAYQNWNIFDNMRGLPVGGQEPLLLANTADSEVTNTDYISVNATGFQVVQGNGNATNENGGTYIYIAIRRGPMKTPTSGTSVFSPTTRTGTNSAATVTGVGFAPDLFLTSDRNAAAHGGISGSVGVFVDKLRGGNNYLISQNTGAEGSGVNISFQNTGISYGGSDLNTSPYDYANWFFVRAPSFMDEVCYTGTGSATTITHNLGVTPELIIQKRRNLSAGWNVYSAALGTGKNIELQYNYAAYTVSGIWDSVSATNFGIGTDATINASGGTYVAYLFASCPGVSKVGSYTGTGATLTVSCGFAARWVMIKRTDSTGNWWVWDTARGMVAGTDPRLAMNSSAAEVNANWVYTDASGFQIVTTDATVNASGGSYIYLAIA